MIDNKLKGVLKQNVGAILDIMERNGVDVSKYRKLAEELKEQDKRKRENARARDKRYRTSATAFLSSFAYSDIRAEARREEKDSLQALKDCLTVADELTDKLQDFLSVATAIKAGKAPYYKKAQPRLKSLENRPSITETAQKRKQERREQAKQEFIKYYSESWFFLLLDLMQKQKVKKEQIQ